MIQKGPEPVAATTGARVVLADRASSSGSMTQMTFGATTYDTASYVSGSTFVVPASGFYLLQARCFEASPGDGDILIFGYSINSASVGAEFAAVEAGNGSDAFRNEGGGIVLKLTAADVIRVFLQSSQATAGGFALITKL